MTGKYQKNKYIERWEKRAKGVVWALSMGMYIKWATIRMAVTTGRASRGAMSTKRAFTLVLMSMLVLHQHSGFRLVNAVDVDENCETLPSEIHLIKGFFHHQILNMLDPINNSMFCSQRGIRRTRPTTTNMQRRSGGQQMRRRMQQSSSTLGDNAHWLPEGNLGRETYLTSNYRLSCFSGVSLLPRDVFARTSRDADPLLRSRRHAAVHSGDCIDGHQTQRTGRLQMLQMRGFQQIKVDAHTNMFTISDYKQNDEIN